MKHINYAIFQLKENANNNPIQYRRYKYLQREGIIPKINRYQEVYRDTEEKRRRYRYAVRKTV